MVRKKRWAVWCLKARDSKFCAERHERVVLKYIFYDSGVVSSLSYQIDDAVGVEE